MKLVLITLATLHILSACTLVTSTGFEETYSITTINGVVTEKTFTRTEW